MSRIVVALGGNALGSTPAAQAESIRAVAPALVSLITAEDEIILTHGNGPQVGAIVRAFRLAADTDPSVPRMPLPEATAMSQGYIGYHLQREVQAEIARRGRPWHVASVVTQVVVDEGDPAFATPTKPIGSFMSREEAQALVSADPGTVVAQDPQRGWRRVVASPRPREIVEWESILNLLDADFVVVACGGGGIPVVREEGGTLRGVEAVVDKDFSAGLLAESVGADTLLVLTSVEKVRLGRGTPEEREVDRLTSARARELARAGEFGPGSMEPKVLAGADFVEGSPGRRAIIASIHQAGEALAGRAGTLITAGV
ncbi:MAG: carbamate kinase [Propionibacterium sp.]|nr:carbamate kinase [Propionibacterium sp.]